MSWKDDLNYGLAAFGVQIPERISVNDWTEKLTQKPLANTTRLIAASSVIFFFAEREHNPKVRDIFSAIEYCSTCLSVGFSDILPRTPIGKLIGSTLMTIGPGVTDRLFEHQFDKRRDEVQEQILATLKEILTRLPADGGSVASAVDQPPESNGERLPDRD